MWTALTALALVALRAAGEPPAAPEGYRERWQRLVDGWVWRPAPERKAEPLRGRGADDGIVGLVPGEWWFAEARAFESFRVVPAEDQQPAGSALELYAVTRGSMEVGPRPDHLGMPPPRSSLLAERLPLREKPGEARAELSPGQDADWIGVRCVARNVALYRFALDGYERVAEEESWERLERAVRAAARPGEPWPVPSDPLTLPGRDVGRFLRSQRVLLPWGPAGDEGEERALRAVAWCATDLQSRSPVWRHARVRDWDESGVPGYDDRLGRPWRRADSREGEVEGPCVLRVIVRSAVLVKEAQDLGSLDVAVSVGDATWRLAGWPGADVEETSRIWDEEDFLAGGRPPDRWLVSSPRELRVNVPPGPWKVRVRSQRPVYSLVQELESIDQVEHRSPFRSLPSFDAASGRRAAAAQAVALELKGEWGRALQVLEPAATEPEGPFSDWSLWKSLELALLVGDGQAADRVAPLLAVRLPELHGDLAAEARLSLLRFALATRRDGMAAQVAQWIFDDPPAEPEDFVEALAAWCIGRRPLERMRAWPLSAEPRVLRRFLRDVEARSIREVFGTWAELGTVGTTAGGRRWFIPVVPQVGLRPLRADALSGLLNARSSSGAGPWHVARAEDLRAVATGEGFLQILPAADWLTPVSLEVGRASPGARSFGRIRFRDPHNLGLLALADAAAGEALSARPVEHTDRVFLWRGNNVVFGAASEERRMDARLGSVPDAVKRTGDVTERWGVITDLFPLQGPPGSLPAVTFRGDDFGRAGIIRYRFAVATRAGAATADVDAPFAIYVGAEELPGRRLLWISRAEGETGDRETAAGPPVESYAPGPVVSGLVLVSPGPALVRIEAAREWTAYATVSELDIGATPAELLIRRAAGSERRAPFSGLWDPPLGVTGDASEAQETAAATVAIENAPDAQARAAAFESRARLMFRLGRSQSVPDLEAAEALYPENSLDRDRVSLALAVVAFRAGDDLELRARVEAIIRAGGRSRELFLLAAVAALGTDDLPSARAWFAQARLEDPDASTDLERFVAVAIDEPPPAGEPADPLMAVMTDLLRLRRLDPATEVAPVLARIADRCETEALLSASRYLFGRGARFAAWARDARLVTPFAGTSDWPPPRGVLAPLERARDLRSEEVVATPPVVRLSGRYGAWEAVWMTEGAELSLVLPGPEVYEFNWRSAHAVVDGLPRRDAAPARIVVEGLPGIGTRAIMTSLPANGVTCERLPWAVPGRSDTWRAIAPSGTSRVRVRLEAGAGFLSVRRLAGPVWMAWDARAGAAPAAAPFPPPQDLPAFAPDPRAPLVDDIRRRLDESRRVSSAAGAARPADVDSLTTLGDDLLFAVLMRLPGSDPEWVVRALDLYLKAHADGLGSPHWQAHVDLSRILTRWTAVDLSVDLPDFRRVRIAQDLPDDPAIAVSNALFFPFAGEAATVLFDESDLVEWHHRAAAEQALHVDLVAAPDDPAIPVFYELSRDGAVVGTGTIEPGRRTTVAAGSTRESLVSVRVGSARPFARVRARARLLVETPDGLVPVRPERSGILYRAPAGKRSFEVRGPTLVRMETWAATDLQATDDPAVWQAEPAPIARTLYRGVPRAGASSAEFELEHDAYVRVSVRTVDGAALAAAVPPPPASGAIAGETEAPPAPDLLPAPAPGQREAWRLVEYPGLLETWLTGYLRDAGSLAYNEDSERNELVGGVRLHWKAFEAPVYTRLTATLRKEAGFNPVHGAQVRFRHGFLDVPDLDYRIDLDYSGEPLGDGYYGYSWETDLRLRWRQPLDEQWIFYLAGHFNYWWSSLRDGKLTRDPPHTLVYSDYRASHNRWLQFEARLRALPWQNVYVDMMAATRSEPTLRPWEPERVTYGVQAGAHVENLFAELELDRIVRFDCSHRAHRSSERGVGLTLAYERWLGPGAWMSLEAGGRWSPDSHARSAHLTLTLRFGGRSGDRLNHVDPDSVRFLDYQQSRAPWQP
ncbi:MAG: hypothetical protein IT452_00425 [Planctomycetia bacterium]|nr:hypothetical protein [Planctomycetia bacterium]